MTEFRHSPDSLAEALDRLLPDGQPALSQSDDPLVDAALRLAQAPLPALPAEANSRIHQAMLNHARRQPRPLRPSFAPLLRWALVASVLLVLMLIPTSQAVLASVPGDLLYPFKAPVEQLERSLAASPEGRAALSLTHAGRRKHEFEVLLERGKFEAPLLAAAYDQIARAVDLIGTDTAFDPLLADSLESESKRLTRELEMLLDQASQPEHPLAATLIPYLTQAAPTPQSQALPAVEASPTPTSTPSPVPSETPGPSSTPSPTPSATLEANITLMGPVEAINGSIVLVYGIEFIFDPGDILLTVLQIGDLLRIEGQIIDSEGGTVTATVIRSEFNEDSVAISDDGSEIWRDDGTCNNPPPAWAVANGWRRRCETAPAAPGQGSNNGQGNSNNNNRNNSNRSSRGRSS